MPCSPHLPPRGSALRRQASSVRDRRADVALLLPAVAAALLASCSAFTGEGMGPADEEAAQYVPARTEIVSPGLGEPNSEPLYPLRPGYRRLYGDHVRVVTGRETRWGKEVWRLVTVGDINYYSESAEGVFYEGSLAKGRIKQPYLLVPAAVKHKMRWQVWLAGEKAKFTFFAEDLGVQETIFGSRRVWRLSQRDQNDDATQSTDYAEGRGLLSADGSAGPSLVVLPLAQAAVAASPGPKLAKLEPLNSGKPLAENVGPHTASLVPTPDLPSLPWKLRVGVLGIYSDNPTGRLPFFNTWPRSLCFQTDGKDFVAAGDYSGNWPVQGIDNGTSLECLEASTTVFHQGKVQGVQSGYDGGTKADKLTTLIRPDGAIWEIARAPGDGHGWWVAGPLGKSTAYPWQIGAAPLERPWHRMTPWRRLLAVATAPADSLPFALLGADQLFFGKLGPDGFSGLQPGPTLPGQGIHALLEEKQRQLWSTAADGLVSRVLIDASGIKVEPMARLALPAGHELAGALPLSGSLMVLTRAGRVPGIPATQMPKLGNLMVFRAALPTAPLAGEPAPTMPEVTASPEALDLRLCLTGGKLVPTGATLGGKAVKTVADGSCLLLLRDRSEAPDPKAVGLFAAEVEVEGIGRLAIGVENVGLGGGAAPSSLAEAGTTSVLHPGISALGVLAGGGAVGASYAYGPGLVPIGPRAGPVAQSGGVYGIACQDIAGQGLWAQTGQPIQGGKCGAIGEPCQEVFRVDNKSAGPPVLVPYGVTLSPAGGGGHLRRDGSDPKPATQMILVKPDGSFSKHDPSFNLASNWGGALADGTICGQDQVGTRNDTLACLAPGGAKSSLPLVFGGQQIWPEVWIPISSGFYLHEQQTCTFYFLDPKAMKIELVKWPGNSKPDFVKDGCSVVPTWDAAGGAWGLLTGYNAGFYTWQILHLAGLEATLYPPPPAPGPPQEKPEVLVVDEKVFAVRWPKQTPPGDVWRWAR